MAGSVSEVVAFIESDDGPDDELRFEVDVDGWVHLPLEDVERLLGALGASWSERPI